MISNYKQAIISPFVGVCELLFASCSSFVGVQESGVVFACC